VKPLSNLVIIKPRRDNVKPVFLLGMGELCYNVLILRYGLRMMRVSIIGLGLIGGSLGLAFRKSEADVEVMGYARRPEVASRAVERGAADRTEGSAVAACQDADVVFIAVPTMAVRELFADIGGHLGDGAIVTDTASTKAMVMSWADQILPPSVNFVGGHPMAGREASGIDAADGELFRGCTYCLVPGRNAAEETVAELEKMVKRIGANPLLIEADEHDNLVAGISHLPMLVSTALVAATINSPSWPGMMRLAATGFGDITRLASSDPRMWRDICITNKEHIIKWVDLYIEELEKMRSQIDGYGADLEDTFIQLKKEREAWLRMKGN
jgi:prephenate dehydrogenase